MTTTNTSDEVDTEARQNQQIQQFYSKVSSKCEKYRNAVEKDRQKKSTLYSSLEKDFGGLEALMKAIEDRKSEMKSETP